MSREALEGVRTKYAELLLMRLEHDAGVRDEARTRLRMAGLATRFPGALRELDDLELGEIRRRVSALDAVLVGNAMVDPWMRAVVLFHSLARGALCAKRWLAGRKHVDPLILNAYARAVPGLQFPADALDWTDDLARVAKPPRGRLLDLIFARLAGQLRTSEEEARRLVFGIPRKERIRRSPAGRSSGERAGTLGRGR